MKEINFKNIYAHVSKWAFPLLIVLFILSWRECRHRGESLADLSISLDSAARQAKHYENEKGQLIAENRQLEAQGSAQLQRLTDTIFNLKKENSKQVKTVQQYAQIIQKFQVKDKFVPFDPVPVDSPVVVAPQPGPVDTNKIRVPRTFNYSDSGTTVAGTVTYRGVTLDSIGVENTVHFRTVTNKVGFLKLGRETTVQVLNSNKDVQTVGVISIAVPHKVGWWHRWGKPVLFAALAGVAVNQIK